MHELTLTGDIPSYREKLTWHTLQPQLTDPVTLALGHHQDGPSIELFCKAFVSTSSDHQRIFWKAKSGWKSMDTSALALADPLVQLQGYIDEQMNFLLSRVRGTEPLAQVLRLARPHKEVSTQTFVYATD